jgi:agmatinase
MRDEPGSLITLGQFRQLEAAGTTQRVQEQLADCYAIYVSLDIDALDRGFAPATGNTATFVGMDAREMVDLVAGLSELQLGAIDLVEVAPNWDPSVRTPVLAAAILHAASGGQKRSRPQVGNRTGVTELMRSNVDFRLNADPLGELIEP